MTVVNAMRSPDGDQAGWVSAFLLLERSVLPFPSGRIVQIRWGLPALLRSKSEYAIAPPGDHDGWISVPGETVPTADFT